MRVIQDTVQLALFTTLSFCLTACAPSATFTPFIPPTQSENIFIPTQNSIPSLTETTNPTIPPPTSTPQITPTPCTNGLTYIQDLTIPDNTIVSSGQSVDKEWLVNNSGSCNWDASYRLKLISGSLLGAANELALYPARAGTQATLEIVFTAPSEPGTYRSAWQAFSPEGQAFGDAIYIQIIVQ